MRADVPLQRPPAHPQRRRTPRLPGNATDRHRRGAAPTGCRGRRSGAVPAGRHRARLGSAVDKCN